MKSILDLAPAPAARAGIALALCSMGLAGCSTVKSISPFTSSVPYAQNVQPTVPRPAQPEIPVYKKPPVEAEAVAPAQAEAASAPVAAPERAPTPAPAPPASASRPRAQPAPPSPSPSAPSSPTPAPQTNSATGQNDGTEPLPAPGTRKGDAPPPAIPADRMAFQDNGQYRNLAQVPARPKDLPTFAEARATEKALAADRSSSANASSGSVTQTAMAGSRPQDSAPCGDSEPTAQPTTTLRFDHGSAKLGTDQSGVLSEAIADIRTGGGTIRIVGHGDSDVGAAQGAARFDLAMARAGAVADALAGFGIPPQRIALVVACGDSPAVGASVQLYAKS